MTKQSKSLGGFLIENKYSTNLYKLPVRKEDMERVVIKQNMLAEEQKSHIKNLSNAIDFVVPENVKIFAALDGEVTTVKDDSNVGGPDKKFKREANFVVIKHANREFSHYSHFRCKGIVVKPGDKVKQGQLLGYVGMTGYTFRPHLHFEVFIWPSPTAKPDQRQTIKARFEDFKDIYKIGE